MKIDFQKDLQINVKKFLNSLIDSEYPYDFLPVAEYPTKKGKDLKLGFSCLGLKSFYMTGLWESLPSTTQEKWIDYINSFQIDFKDLPRNSFIDQAYLKSYEEKSFSDLLKQYIKKLLINFSFNFDTDEKKLRDGVRAETKQAISTLYQVDSKNKKPFDDFPKNSEDIIKFLDNLNWQKPWAAGAQFAALCVFAKTQLSDSDFKNTSKVLLDYIDDKADIKTGCYFDKPQPDENEMMNGAMKVLTGLDWLDARIHNPEQLIDFCLNSSPSHDGCDIVDTVYVLYRTTKETDYKSDDINEYLIKIIDVIEKHYFYGIGGFSYFVNKSQTKYYGANIADGKNEPDIHGTTLLIWALSMILEITGDSLLNWKVIKP